MWGRTAQGRSGSPDDIVEAPEIGGEAGSGSPGDIVEAPEVGGEAGVAGPLLVQVAVIFLLNKN